MIAFAYCDTGPKFTAMYRTLLDGLIPNLRSVMPDEQILMVTDEKSPIVKGINQVLRVDRTMPLMTWRLKAHQMAHQMGEEILFTEPDVRFSANIMAEMPPGDVVVTTREDEVRLEDCDKDTDFTLGMTYSRSAEFWREAKLICQSLDEKNQNWFGDMIAIAKVIKEGSFNVAMLDGAIYNHVINDPFAKQSARVLHYKGKRKQWLLPHGAEETDPEAQAA